MFVCLLCSLLNRGLHEVLSSLDYEWKRVLHGVPFYLLHKMLVRLRHLSFLESISTIYLPRVILNPCIFSNRLHNTQNCSERLSLEGPNSDNRVLSPHNKSNMSGTDLRINWLGLQS